MTPTTKYKGHEVADEDEYSDKFGNTRHFHTVRFEGGEILRCPKGVGGGGWDHRSDINPNWWHGGDQMRWCCPHGTLLQRRDDSWSWSVEREGPCPENDPCGYPDISPITDEDVQETGEKLLALLNRMENHGDQS